MGVLGKKRKWIDYLCGTEHIVSAIFPSSSAVICQPTTLKSRCHVLSIPSLQCLGLVSVSEL